MQWETLETLKEYNEEEVNESDSPAENNSTDKILKPEVQKNKTPIMDFTISCNFQIPLNEDTTSKKTFFGQY